MGQMVYRLPCGRDLKRITTKLKNKVKKEGYTLI